jgi:predicted acyl esterase
VVLDYSTKASTYWVEGRLFDLAPNGAMTMVSRSSCRVDLPSASQRGCSAFELSGNGWRFEKNHRVVLELTSADTPYLRKSNQPSNLNVSSAILKIPIVPEAQRRDFRK